MTKITARNYYDALEVRLDTCETEEEEDHSSGD